MTQLSVRRILFDLQKKECIMGGSQETSRPQAKSGEESEGINPSTNVDCLYYSIKPRSGLVLSVLFGDRTTLHYTWLPFMPQDV